MLNSRTFRLAALVATAALAFGPASADPGAGAPSIATTGDVRTIAGSGDAGLADGPTLSASFLAPYGVAVAEDGTTYVSDAEGERIRRIERDGSVSTVAGGGDVDAAGLSVPGGYRDGDTSAARFDKPQGLAFGPDGALYVADERNHCIRRIAGGTVDTFAGAPTRPGRTDGDRRSARFGFPRGLAFDRAGDLFVADFGTGLRKIAADGHVSTLRTPGMKPQTIGVATFGAGASATVFVSNLDGLGVLRADGRDFRFLTTAESGVFGFPYALAALSADEAVFSDVRTHTIRYVRAPRPPAIGTTLVATIGGLAREDTDAGAGSEDGSRATARFDIPTGIALARDGALVIADAGARRVRRLALPSLRQPVTNARALDRARGDYRVVYLSNSYAWYDGLWDTSTPGVLESRLRRERALLGIGRLPHVDTVRLDGASLHVLRHYIETAVAAARPDLLVLNLNMPEVYVDIAHHRALQSGSGWIAYTAGELRAMRTALGKRKVAFVAVVEPSPFDASPTESLALRERTIVQRLTFEAFDAAVRDLGVAARRSGANVVDLVPTVDDRERERGDTPLFGAGGFLSPAGDALVAESVMDALERHRPWTGAPRSRAAGA